MKQRFGILLIALLTLSFSGIAQQQERGERGNRQDWSPAARAERMAKDLELTADQKVKVQALFEKQQAEMVKLREEGQASTDREARRQQMTELRKKWDADLEKIIGAEKMAKHKAMQEERTRNRQRQNNNQ